MGVGQKLTSGIWLQGGPQTIRAQPIYKVVELQGVGVPTIQRFGGADELVGQGLKVDVGVGGALLPPARPPLVNLMLSSPRDVATLFSADFQGHSLVLSWGNRGPCTLHDDGTADCTWLCPRTLCRWRYTGPRAIIVTGWYFGFGQVRCTLTQFLFQLTGILARQQVCVWLSQIAITQ